MNRRDFMRLSMAGLAAAAGGLPGLSPAAATSTVRIGMIGTGNRGGYLTGLLCRFPETAIPAVCDLLPEAAGPDPKSMQVTNTPTGTC